MPEPLDPNERFAGNTAINAHIHELLASFLEPSRSRMRTRIRQARDAITRHGTEDADAQARHIFREFLVGARLNGNGFNLEYDRRVGDKTPDWYDDEEKLLIEVFTCERDGRTLPVQRVAARISEKVNIYRELVEAQGLFFVVAVYGDFCCCIDEDDCEDAIKNEDLFNKHKELGGVIFFTETNVVQGRQKYGFRFFQNSYAIRQIDLTQSLGDPWPESSELKD